MTSIIMLNGMAVLVLGIPKEDTTGRLWATIGVIYLGITIAAVKFFLWWHIFDMWKDDAHQ